MVTTIALTMLWFYVGAASYLYWWNKTGDKFTGLPGEIQLLAVCSLVGPITFLAGWLMNKHLKS